MTIFFITSWFPSRVHPTNGNFVGRHARLVAREHEVIVVAVEADENLPFGTTEVTQRTEDGYKVVHVYAGYGPQTPGWLKIAARLKAYVSGMKVARSEYGLPDLLHGHVLLDGGMVASLYAKWWSRPFVLTEHSTAYHNAGALSGLRALLGRYACRKAKRIMPVSDHLGRSMRERNGLSGAYLTVSNVVNEELYHLEPPPGLSPFNFLHVSNFDEGPKNITGIIRAFSGMDQRPDKPITLHFAGDGDLVELRRMIAATGHASITCSGPHTEGEIAELMQSCHAFVLFSNYENQPVVLLEAQMSGRPCIATPVGGIPDIILPGKTGTLVPVGGEAALAAAIVELRDNYEAFNLKKIRERALSLYSEAAVLKSLNEVYLEVVK